MKKIIIPLILLNLYSYSQELSIDAGAYISIDSGASLNITGLELQPSVDYTISGENSITFSGIPIMVGGNESIAKSFNNLNALNNYTGTIILHYDESELNGLDESKLILEVKDDLSVWNSYSSTVDLSLNTVTYNFESAINFLTVTASSSESPLGQENLVNTTNKISIFPNPVVSKLNIQSNNDFSIEIFNLLGERIEKSSKKTIDLNHISSGVYILIITELRTEHKTIHKFLKK